MAETERMGLCSLRLGFVVVGALAVGCGDDGSPADAAGLDGGPRPDGAPIPDGAVPLDGGPPLRVLFLGNSYTYVNDLPGTMRAIGGATPGAAVETEMIAVGGATLYDHWVSTGGQARVEMGGLDVVVMQGQSLEALDEMTFVYSAGLWTDALNAAGVRAVWYATWARAVTAPDAMDPVRMTRLIDESYAAAAALREGDVVARVGVAWRMALAELPEVVLYDADGSHPSPAGTLLTACVILHAMTGRTPVVPDPAPLGVPIETARALCDIAPRIRCLEDQNLCDGACTEPLFDPAHCGGCGVACAGGDPCRAGVCGCDPGDTGCSRSCVDLETDVRNCGACGTTCDVGGVCTSGACECPAASVQLVEDATLMALRPGCVPGGPDTPRTPDCIAAIHEHCAALGCFDSGFGPPTGHSPPIYDSMCVQGDVRATTYTALAALVPGCDGVAERVGVNCVTAVHRYCVSTGAVSGFGPVESSGDDATVTCLPDAVLVPTTIADLSAFATRCLPSAFDCNAAAWAFCQSLGHLGGFGPVETSGTDAHVVCFPS